MNAPSPYHPTILPSYHPTILPSYHPPSRVASRLLTAFHRCVPVTSERWVDDANKYRELELLGHCVADSVRVHAPHLSHMQPWRGAVGTWHVHVACGPPTHVD